MTRAGRFLLAFALAAALPVLAVAATNLAIDVQGLYSGDPRTLSGAARRYVAVLRATPQGLPRFEGERAVKVALAGTGEADCWVVGSSRVMGLTRDHVARLFDDCAEAINLGVSGAAFGDVIGYLGAVIDQPRTRRVVVGVDPWTLRQSDELSWARMRDFERAGRRRFGIPAPEPDATERQASLAANLVNWQYFRRNVSALFTGVADVEECVERLEACTRIGDQGRFMPDGSLVFPPGYHPLGRVDGSYRMHRPLAEPGVLRQLERMVGTAREEEVELSLLLVPYAPSVWDCADAGTCRLLAEMEALVRELAARLDLEVRGSYHPRRFAMSEADFHDPLHPTPTGLARLR